MLDSLKVYLGERPLIEALGPLGRRSARQAYQRRFVAALSIAGGLHVTLTAATILLRLEHPPAIVDPGPRPRIYEFDLPPSMREPAAPKPPGGGAAGPVFKLPAAGVPVPVPAPEAKSETIRPESQNGIGGEILTSGIGDESVLGGGGDGSGTGIATEAPSDRPDPDLFQPVEKQAKLVDGPAPVYPELARLSKIEGTVHVRALVGTDGKVREAFVLRAVNDLLDQAAISATMGYVFLPAMQNGRPVPVWVTIPFRFSLR